MVEIIVQIIIVLLECLVLLAARHLGKNNPRMIAGFKWGVTSSEVAEDKRWLKSFDRLMQLNIYVTFVGSLVGAFLGLFCTYMLFLTLPTLLVVLYLAVTMPRGGHRM